MNTWLFKSEPSAWSWQDQVDAGAKGAEWDGVRNYQASNNMKAMQVGDLGFFYHSVTEKAIVGIVEVIAPYYPDPTDPSQRFGMVDVRAVKAMGRAVTLKEMKANPRLADLGLIRQGRLSVVAVSPQHWVEVLRMGATVL